MRAAAKDDSEDMPESISEDALTWSNGSRCSPGALSGLHDMLQRPMEQQVDKACIANAVSPCAHANVARRNGELSIDSAAEVLRRTAETLLHSREEPEGAADAVWLPLAASQTDAASTHSELAVDFALCCRCQKRRWRP